MTGFREAEWCCVCLCLCERLYAVDVRYVPH